MREADKVVQFGSWAPVLPSLNTKVQSEKSLPAIKLTKGITMPLIKVVVTEVNAAPITNPTAKSTRLPFIAKALNSLIIPIKINLKVKESG